MLAIIIAWHAYTAWWRIVKAQVTAAPAEDE